MEQDKELVVDSVVEVEVLDGDMTADIQTEKEPNNGNTLGLISLVLSVMGFLSGFTIVGLIVDVVAAAFGTVSIILKKPKKWYGIVGVVISTIGFIATIVMYIIGGLFLRKKFYKLCEITKLIKQI
ncbi:MAG: hypothetical protein R3Y67_04930 [Eubacteriales bacterium]